MNELIEMHANKFNTEGNALFIYNSTGTSIPQTFKKTHERFWSVADVAIKRALSRKDFRLQFVEQ